MHAQVSVIGPDGRTQPLTLEQTGPGHYDANFDGSQTGSYIVTAAQQAAGSLAKPAITRAGYSVAYPPEYEAIGPDMNLLQEITKTTGGRIVSNPVEAFEASDRPGTSVSDLWPSLLLAAALLFVLDIAVRRLAIPFAEIAAGRAGEARRFPPAS